MINGNDQIIREKPQTDHNNLSLEIGNTLDSSQQQQLVLPSKFITHHPKSGINPLVDAAAYLLSVIGKLKQLKSHLNLTKLHQELLQEINAFQEAIQAQGYASEYLLVSRYTLCATLDDIIENTPWGSHGQWQSHSLLATLNQETAQQQDRFFIILDRIVKEPTLYIDVMELMYLCLNLGYKGCYRSTEFSQTQLEQIINALYKRIRNYRGDFSKTLSPFAIKTSQQPKQKTKKTLPLWMIIVITLFIMAGLFIGLRYLLDSTSNLTNQELMHIGKSILYETPNT